MFVSCIELKKEREGCEAAQVLNQTHQPSHQRTDVFPGKFASTGRKRLPSFLHLPPLPETELAPLSIWLVSHASGLRQRKRHAPKCCWSWVALEQSVPGVVPIAGRFGSRAFQGSNLTKLIGFIPTLPSIVLHLTPRFTFKPQRISC